MRACASHTLLGVCTTSIFPMLVPFPVSCFGLIERQSFPPTSTPRGCVRSRLRALAPSASCSTRIIERACELYYLILVSRRNLREVRREDGTLRPLEEGEACLCLRDVPTV